MPDEQFQAFLQAAKSDPNLQNALKAATKSEEVITLARKAGFTIEADCVATQSSLSEEELESIDGGNCVTATWFNI
ncbi:MAG: Nif11-like leader peptide family natural product precursor [Cyanobacteriota bacterium]|nr:Nif11-like leader peptide family natural product precursor [Cyanobacteriota bacterium]